MRIPALILLLFMLPTPALAQSLRIFVGSKATWINLDTGVERIEGRRIGRIEIDSALIREKCFEVVEDFGGHVRLRPETRGRGFDVRVECMWRREPTIASESGQSVETTPSAALDSPTAATVGDG